MYEDMRQAQAYKQRQEEMDRLWSHKGNMITATNTAVPIIEEIKKELADMRKEIMELKNHINELHVYIEDVV